MKFKAEREFMCKVSKAIFDRHLTDASGGNLSQRVTDDLFIMTPTLASVNHLWDLTPEQILLVNKDLDIIEGEGRTTREINMHMEFYQADPRIKAIVHAHPRNTMVYGAMGVDLPVTCENLRFGPDKIKCLNYAPATTVKLADKVYEYANEMANIDSPLAYGMILREHGFICGASTLGFANDYLERVETNAYVHLMSHNLTKSGYRYYTEFTDVEYEIHE